MKTSEICQDDTKRRRAVRAHRDAQTNQPDLNGIDYLEVSEYDQRILRVHFMDKAPENIIPTNVRIDGGRRIRKIRVEEVELCKTVDEEQPDCMEVRVDRAGDFSTYTLCLVDLDADGHPTGNQLTGFDVRYTCIDFTFKANCPSDLDCAPTDTCPPGVLDEPEIDYLAKDYASFRQLILDRLSLIMPGWQERHIPDIGITLVEILAYVGDYLGYYQDAVATEAYLETARQRISVRRHTRLVDYPMHEGCNARTWLFLEMLGTTNLELKAEDIYFITGQNDVLPVSSTILSELDLQGIPSSDYEVFEPLLLGIDPQQSIQLYEVHNKISFYTWGEQECCLPRGATTATLKYEWVALPAPVVEVTQQQESSKASSTSPAKSSKSKRAKQQQPPEVSSTPTEPQPEPKRQLNLHVGDVLIFEEVLGPKTANHADADPKHRHAVRLTKVEPALDILYNIPVVEIAWGEEDKLPFPLCLSGIGPAPKCKLLEDISIARGNVILVDYGKTINEDLKEEVPTEKTIARCDECTGGVGDTEVIPGLYRPQLQQAPMTFRELLPPDAPFFQPQIPDATNPVSLTSASSLLIQDPRNSLPDIRLTSTPPADGGTLYTIPQDGEEDDEDEDEKEIESTTSADTSKDIVWTVQRDLLESQGDDYDYVVEMDNDGYAHLRFGDGELGHMPEAGTKFHARYRVGNGLPGNVGAESISHIVFRQNLVSDVKLQPCNPFSVSGGTDPEPLAEIKLFAPHAFRSSKNLQRAITADDYARLAERYPGVQRAAATLRWIGSWYEALVVIDPLGTEEADQALLDGVTAYLEQYRRMGHDLLVIPAHYVSLDIAMTICVQPHFLRGHVKAALLDLFSNRVLPNGKLGFFHPDNLTFGQGIAVSKLVATAQAVPGVQSVTITKLERLFEGPNNELQQEFLDLRLQEIARLDNDPSFPEHGKIVFTMEGGR